MASKKTFEIEFEGEMHKYKIKPPKRSTMVKLQQLDADYDGEDTEDWGVELLVSSIDGEDPLEADELLQWEVMLEVIDFLGATFKTNTSRKRAKVGKV